MEGLADIPRRAFLETVTGLGLAGLVASSLRGETAVSDGLSPLSLADVSLQHATAHDFAPLVGTVFRIHVSPRRFLDVQLVRSQEYRPRQVQRAAPADPSLRPPFSLHFQSASRQPLPQDTYRIAHPMLGTFSLFLVPIGPHQGPVVYEAAFN